MSPPGAPRARGATLLRAPGWEIFFMKRSPLAFSAAELEVLTKLAAPLDPELRDPFLRAVAIDLARYRSAERSLGLVNRVGRELLREITGARR